MTVIPPLDPDDLLVLLVGLATLLLVARILGRLATLVGLPSIVGELLTGVLLGPSLLGHLFPQAARLLIPSDAGGMHLIDAVGQLGVLLLVGITGTHLDPSLLGDRRRRRAAVTVSLSGLVLPLLCGVGLGLALSAPAGDGRTERILFALFLGVAMGVTALPVIAKTLADMGLLHRTVGQLILMAGTVDDAACWFLLSLLAAAATTGLTVGSMAVSVAALAGFAVFAATVGRIAVGAVMRRAARSTDAGPTVAATVVIVLIGAALSHGLGLEAVVGAFVAGLLIGAPDPAKLAPLRTVVLTVLAPIFLATAGLRIDLTALADPGLAWTALAVVLVAVGGKFCGAYVGARLSGMTTWEGLAVGAGMNSRGVVEVIVALAGLRLGIFDVGMYTVIVLVAILTSVMAPPMLRLTLGRVRVDGEERRRRLRIEGADPRQAARASP
ncbi:cation:proton antiporter [Micromonospora sp. 15K316]|uniref:cation:proton antiporter n=1 Tax=Micromonospora sp. 15K316 TaxID=2530376 RepID=UPI0010457A0B|nr:cation:proton antiporter [Micromonospora sp. 15K316]TDC40378.1 cation:proton antiporter [Micromonospora sp. 15K316]